MSKHAVLVLGPESSGTRLMTKFVIDAGAFGDDGHDQRVENDDDPGSLPDFIVHRRSFPHGRFWTITKNLIDRYATAGYRVSAIVTTRDWYSMIESQLKAGYTRTREESESNIRRAYQMIFTGVSAIQYVVASYESVCRYRQRALMTMFESLMIPVPSVSARIVDANPPYYEALS